MVVLDKKKYTYCRFIIFSVTFDEYFIHLILQMGFFQTIIVIIWILNRNINFHTLLYCDWIHCDWLQPNCRLLLAFRIQGHWPMTRKNFLEYLHCRWKLIYIDRLYAIMNFSLKIIHSSEFQIFPKIFSWNIIDIKKLNYWIYSTSCEIPSEIEYYQ